MTDPRSQVGPMARYAADLAIALRVLAGPDGIDSGVVPVPLPKRVPKLGGLRVAWYADDGMAKPMPAITARVKEAARALGAAGGGVTKERPPWLTEAYHEARVFCGRQPVNAHRMRASGERLRAPV